MAERTGSKGKHLNTNLSTTTDHVKFSVRSKDLKKFQKMPHPHIQDSKVYFSNTTNIPVKSMGLLELENYSIGNSLNGPVHIFNHYEFERKLDLSPRGGTDRDESSLVELFTSIGFSSRNILLHKDLKHSEIFDILEKESTADHTDHNIFICVVLTHGENGLLYSRNKKYSTSQLWTFFNDKDCPSLQGKPKLFFIQACRGSNLDSGIEMNLNTQLLENNASPETYESPGQPVPDSLNAEIHQQSVSRQTLHVPEHDAQRRISEPLLNLPPNLRRSRRRSETWDSSATIQNSGYSIHTDPDILVAYSTFEGFYSFRRATAGSWFIQALCKVMKESWKKDDLVSILTQVNLRVAVDMISSVSDVRKKEFDKKKQIPSFSSTLTKLLYLNPSINN